ncbi:MAG: hypothetical protein D6761_05650 [Candidatus Dadabacteria bacterium]|nr:MAG: hypothetical protein D6761_05650 [Candidatus Dadabacteria bacterium]
MPPLTDTVMILAAGEGRRLRPWTAETPKPLLDVGGRPLLYWTLEHLQRSGFTRIIVNAHHLADQIEAALSSEALHLSAELVVSRETELLGTGGGIRQAARYWPPEGAWIFNGDVVCDYAFSPPSPAEAIMVVRESEQALELGPVWVRDGRVTGLLDRGAGSGHPFMFTGIHYLSRALALDLPESGCVVRDGYTGWLDQHAIAADIHRGFWGEIGTPDAWRAIDAQVRAGAFPWLTGSAQQDRLQ